LEKIVYSVKFEQESIVLIILNIQDYIIEVLLFSEKVNLPGFGSFTIYKKAAEVYGNKVNPPISELRFDSSETLDDEVLAIKISEAEGQSLDIAKQQVLEFIDKIRFSLDKGEKFSIPGFCTLFRDSNNKIDLEKDPALVLDFENFGLESFELDDIEEEETITNSEKEEIIEAKKDEESYAKEEKVPVIRVPSNKKNNRSTVWLIVGSVVVIAAAFIIVPLKTSLFDSNLGFDSFFDEKELVVDDDFSDTEDGEFSFDALVNELEDNIDSATTMVNAMNPVPVMETIPKAEFHIIAGSFKDSKNAELLQKQLTMEGYPALIIEPVSGIFRVSAISYSNKNKALDGLISFRKDMNMSGAWLMNLE